jgi:hypothetical protein
MLFNPEPSAVWDILYSKHDSLFADRVSNCRSSRIAACEQHCQAQPGWQQQ